MLLKKRKAWNDALKVYGCLSANESRQGKTRNRCRIQRGGPCVVHNGDNGLIKAVRNIPAITPLNVSKRNILELAPGGPVGRFCLWTEGAFR